MNEIKKEIMSFLEQFFDVNEINEHTNFIKEGMVNSLFAMQLILFLEEKYNIEIANEDINPENFCSVYTVMQYLKRYTQKN